MKILPISFYAVRLSASVWFRKKLCGKIKVVFNVNVMRRFTIASNRRALGVRLVSLLQAWSWAKGAPIGQRCCAPFAQRFAALRGCDLKT